MGFRRKFITTDGVCENAHIAGSLYRNGDVRIGGHPGVSPEEVEALMDIWLVYYNSPVHNEHPFVKAAVLHYAFEDIHPFCDGNGRVGRLLMHDFLIRCGIEQVKALPFSKEIDASRLRYDAAFVDSQSEDGDCTPFIKYMVSSFALTIQECIRGVIKTENELENSLDESQDTHSNKEKERTDYVR